MEAGRRIGHGDLRGGQAERGRTGGIRDEARADSERPAVGAHHGERPGRGQLHNRPRYLRCRRPRPRRRGNRRRCGRRGCHNPNPAPRGPGGDGEQGRRLLGEDGGRGWERRGEEGRRRQRHCGRLEVEIWWGIFDG